MLLTLLCVVATHKHANLKLNSLFSDGMVLQRFSNAPVFGKAAPGSFVQVLIGNQRAGATADKNGRWLTRLKPLQAGGPYTLTVNSGGETVSVRDVMVGEVWVCSGQSNMEFTESNANDYQVAVSEVKSDIRMFTVQKDTGSEPKSDVVGNWVVGGPNSVGGFSAVGYSFARELHRKLGVPIGMIHSSWGGTPAESWTSYGALNAKPEFKKMAATSKLVANDFPKALEAYQHEMDTWLNGKKGGQNEGFLNGWAAAEFNDSSWKSFPPCTSCETAFDPSFDGSFWYRKSIDIPDAWYGKELKIELGPIDDYDITYFNGVRIGLTDSRVENAWETKRVYRIASGMVRRGANSLAIRVFDSGGGGGMTGPADSLKISLADGSESMPIEGDWKMNIEKRLDPKAPRPIRPLGPGNPWMPTSLYNAMIAPLIPYNIKGVIWYQGESNAERAYQYRDLFPTMIKDWRNKWGMGNFPFYFVQLANYQPRQPEPGESQWAELREAQTMTLKLPNTGMAVIIDIGEAADIHPKNKREVGRRLALQALGKTYHQPLFYDSPRFELLQISGNVAKVTLSNGSLKTSDGRPPQGFAIAGEDRKFYWAEARIDGSVVSLSSPNVPKPVAVRYGWADNPDCNVVNMSGLPASPFRTDDWPGLTAPKTP